ncbi:MAG TPA: FUSC family protein [Nocardioidaceae bacterium]|nr:FUSC family protein [Nocardioidaceae bacterium]
MTGLTRPLRGVRAAFIASDPGLVRFRAASTTIVAIVATLVVLGGLVTIAGQPVTVAIPGVVLAMIASIAVRETEPVPQAIAIALLAPASFVSVGLAATVSGTMVLADAVFVAVAVSAVFLRRLGSRGMATGMVAFISYFLTLFIGLSVEQLPAVAVALVVAALVCVVVGAVLRPRKPDRELRRMLAALGLRAGDVVELLGQGVRGGELTPRLVHRLRSRVDRAQETARAVEEHLDTADASLLELIGNVELGVRVFDFQLVVEDLGVSVRRVLEEDDNLEPAVREDVAAALAAVQSFLENPARRSIVDALATDAAEVSRRGGVPDAVARLHRALAGTVDAWRRVVYPHPDDADATVGERPAEADEDEDEDEGRSSSSSLGDTARQAIQVGLASVLAIVVGIQLSPTRWFWAVITAFVVYIGTSTRGEILTKGWQRVLGTMAGVVAGVLVAAMVGGNTVAAVILILVCLFLAVYLMSVSSAIMVFFITTMLALLYGLLGRFSVDLLVVRLEETVAGALIGVLVSYVVFPASTRQAVREGVRDFLEELGDLLAQSADDLTNADPPGDAAGGNARALRDSFGRLKTTAKPLTDGLAGASARSGPRLTMHVLAACEHHGRMMSRLADETVAVAADPQAHRALDRAARAVRANVEAFAAGVGARMSEVTVYPAVPLVDDLEQVAARIPEDAGRFLAVARHLRAIDHAICARACELGARLTPVGDEQEVGGGAPDATR